MVLRLVDSLKTGLGLRPAECAGVPGAQGGKKQTLWKAALSGGVTGGIEICITYPTEFVKTVQQIRSKQKLGIMQIVRMTVGEHGVFGLYRGLSCLVVFSIPKAGVRFGSKDFFDTHFFTTKSSFNTFVSGGLAGCCEALLAVTPMETLKTKLIDDKLQPKEQQKYRGLIHGIKTIYAEQGFGGVYRGPLPTVMKQGSNQAIRFVVYEKIKHQIDQLFPSAPFSLKTALAGAMAGATSVIANNPIDVVKSKMQGIHGKDYSGVLDCLGKILKTEGVRGFYAGTVPRMARVTADVAITFTLFENIRALMDRLVPS